VDPCIPSSWPEYEIAWRFGKAHYKISVSNPEHQCRGVRTATLDGIATNASAIPLVDDDMTHDVRIVLGPGA
jgi:cellobiose phosphorylase